MRRAVIKSVPQAWEVIPFGHWGVRLTFPLQMIRPDPQLEHLKSNRLWR